MDFGRITAPWHEGIEPSKRTLIEASIPKCACGCGGPLAVPRYIIRRGGTLNSIRSCWIRHPYIQGHGSRLSKLRKHEASCKVIPRDQIGLIYGTLLGDSSIGYPNKESTSPRLASTHGINQADWANYKASRLASLGCKTKEAINQGYGERSIRTASRCHPGLREVYSTVYSGATKTVCADWLMEISEEGIAWWYMDDGSLQVQQCGSRSIRLHTEGYTLREVTLISKWLRSLGFRAFLSSQNGYWYLRLRKADADKWIARFQQFAPPCMEYKFRVSYRR